MSGHESEREREWTPETGSESASPGDAAGELTDEPVTVVEALNRALFQELERDAAVRLLGYDVGPGEGVFRVTEGLHEAFGDDRVVDTPLSENGIIGAATGMAMRGDRVVAEVQFHGFVYPGLGQLYYTMAKTAHRTGGKLSVPMTLRLPYGGGVKSPEFHAEATATYLVHCPGLRVVVPSSPAEAKGLLAASIRSDDPVAFLEPLALYRGHKERVPREPYTLALGEARLAREGTDVSVVTQGAMVNEALAAAERVDASVEVVDLRSLAPLDVETVLESVKKTGRCVPVHQARRTLGVGAEISALVTEYALDRLKAPIKRVSAYDAHVPRNQVEDTYFPDAGRIQNAIEAVMEYQY